MKKVLFFAVLGLFLSCSPDPYSRSRSVGPKLSEEQIAQKKAEEKEQKAIADKEAKESKEKQKELDRQNKQMKKMGLGR